MEKRIHLCLLISLFAFCLVSCESRKVEPDPSRLGYDYFPLETGRYSIFDVHQTYYSLATEPVIHIYQVKDEVSESFTDLSGETAYKLFRYSRKDTLSAWQLDSVWTAKRTPSQAIRTENNVPFVKMVFPLEAQQTWNGNALNNRGSDDYQTEAFRNTYLLPKHTFDNTITVVQQSDSSLIGQDKRLEVYAQGVGLVYREQVQLQFCSTSTECLGQGKIDFGIKFYYRLNSYGKN